MPIPGLTENCVQGYYCFNIHLNQFSLAFSTFSTFSTEMGSAQFTNHPIVVSLWADRNDIYIFSSLLLQNYFWLLC